MNTADLRVDSLHWALEDSALASMDFLNEVAEQYPDAVPLAAGRPHDGFLSPDAVHHHLDTYHRYLRTERGLSPEHASRTMLQYGPAQGVINEVLARHLAVDEGIQTDPESIVVTVGCQEAMFLVLRALRTNDRDFVLAVSPTYVGLNGAAKLADMPVLPVPTDDSGVSLPDLVADIHQARSEGRRPRALYVMPDFANPSAVSMDLSTRQALLRVAEEEDILLIEDNPYGLFHGERHRVPTLKALDRARRVVYLGSFAKTVVPGARVGYAVADQVVTDRDDRSATFAQHLARIKGMLTVNTSPIAQAVVAGRLLENGCSLVRANREERRFYRRNLQHLLRGLASRFAAVSDQVTWNAPAGGFFVVVTLPFRVDDEELRRCADEHAVLWTPMSHFYEVDGGENQLRLSCSAVSAEAIDTGLDGLRDYVIGRLG
ncbi:GntR family transcriptional regulator [Nocardiopsis sp. CNR-923]|uniref:aminotransferase-like domain-containing protein n=1 Tax=Nocardiopsis sp. CNR-923 TaxID=1904965 RepID=UPI00096712E9|nr:PLP-dependent aminotransferase family protein [Nocardiopsis sp. CNR-923]OLT24615.1 GntR family transcriptional regulator [Nocardiopsis sp. CNR-923]